MLTLGCESRMGVQEFYHGVEDKYYAALDWMDKHGIPVYRVVDAIEAQNIPSFPIAALLLLLVVGGLWTFVFPGLLGGNATLNVLVLDETQTPLKGIAVQLSGAGLSGDALSKRLTDNDGTATFTNLPIGASVTVSADHDEYAIDEKSIVLDQGENERKLIATPLAVTKSISLQLYKANSTETFSDAILLSFACSNDAAFSKTSTVAGGQITIDVPPACGSLSVQSLDSTLTLQNAVIDVDDANPRVYVNASQAGDGVLRATLLDESGNGIAGLTALLKSKFGDVLATKFSDSTGFVEFTGLAADTYTIFVQADGVHGELDSGNIEVSDAQPVEKTLTIPLASVGEVRLQFVDEGNLSPVNGAKVTLSRGNQVIATKTTNEGGQVTFSVSSPNNLTVGVDHPSYLVRSGIVVSVSSAGYTQIPLAKATLQNSQIVTVKVVDELNQPVENAYVALKKSPSGASIGTNKITGASGTVQFTSLEEGTYFATAYKPGFSDQIKSDLFSVRARENVESMIKLVIGNGTVSLVVKGSDAQPLAGATIQAVDGVTHTNVGNEIATNVDGTAELTLRADRFVYFVVNEPNHVPYVTLPTQMKKGVTQNVNVEMVKDIAKLEIKTLGTFVGGKPILEDSGLAPGQTYTIRFALMIPRNTNYAEAGVHVRTGNANESQTNPIENDGWYIRDVRGAFSKVQKGTTYTPPAGLGIDSQHVTSADAKWANAVFTPAREGLTIVEVDATVKDTTIQGADLPLYYRTWARTGSYVRFPVDAVLGGSEGVAQKQGLYANANVKLYSTGASTHVCTKDFCLGLVGEDLANGLQASLLDDFEADISSKQKILFTFTSVSDNVFADTSLIIQSTTGSAALKNYDVTNAVGAKKTGAVSGNKVEIPLGTIQKNNVVFGFVNMDAATEGTARVKFSLVSNKKEVYARELLVRVSAAGVLNVEVVPKAILPLLTNQMLIHVTQTASGDEVPLENASVNVALNGVLLTSGFTDSEGVFPFELNEPNVNDDVEITASKQGYKPVTLNVRVGADIVSFIPASLSESLIVNGTTRKTRDLHMLNLASIPLVVKDVSLSGDFDGLVKFDLLNEEIVGETLGVNQDRNVTIALSLTEKGQNLLAAKTLKGSVLVKLSSDESGKTFTNALPLALKIGFGGEVDVEDCLLVDPVEWNVYADPKETKQQAFEIKNTCTVKSVPVKLTNLSAKIKQLSGDSLGTFTVVTNEKTTELSSAFKTILNTIPAGGEIIVTTSFSPAQIESGLAMPQLIFQATNMTDNGVPDTVEETVKVNLVVNSLAKCVQVKTPNILEIDSCAINTGMGQLGSYYNQVYRPTGVPYYNPSFSTLNNTTNPSGSSLLPSNQSGAYGSYLYGSGPFSPQYGASGYDGFGGYQQNGAQFSPLNGYSSMQGPYANPLTDRYNYTSGAGAFFGCGNTEIRIENSCQSDIEIQLDADPNVQVSKTSVILKPNQNERIRVGSGYRIGKYPIFVNARAAGSTEASLEVSVVDVLIKSPTEVNADCITLNTSKFRFQELIQKPVKGKVINKCYNSGVRLVPSADTITIASYFTVNDEVTLTEKGSVRSQPNTMAHDIQLIGVQTRGSGRDTVQELEFQIFPDFETYKRVLSPFTEGAGLGQTILDLKFFLEGQYYRAESYGTISVKYLDAYGGSQQKPFPVIFENLFRIAGVLDIGNGNPNLTNFQQCINEDALQYEAVNAQTGSKTPIVLNDADFKNNTTVTFVTVDPNHVLKVGDNFCGGRDTLSQLKTTRLVSGQNAAVTANFKLVNNRDIEVTVTRPTTLAADAVIQGELELSVTRTAFNIATKPVRVPVKITVTKSGTASGGAAFQPLACTVDAGYVKGTNIRTAYGFDKLSWEWAWNKSPDCTTMFCDATQFTIWMTKKAAAFNELVKNNKAKVGVFATQGKTYTTQNMFQDLLVTKKITDSSNGKEITFLLDKGGAILEAPASVEKATALAVLREMKNVDEDGPPGNYSQALTNRLTTLATNHPNVYANTVILFDAAKVDAITGFAAALTSYGAETITSTKGGKTVSMYVLFLAEFNTVRKLTTADETFYKNVGENIDSVVIGYAYTTDVEKELLTSKDVRTDILARAKMKNDTWYLPYASGEEVISTFFESEVYLMKDSFSQDFFNDFAGQTQAPFAYKADLQNVRVNAVSLTSDALSPSTIAIPPAFITGIKLSDDPLQTTGTVPFSIDGGKYSLSMFAEWTSATTGNFVLNRMVPVVNKVTYTPVAEITTENGDALDYEENIFFEIPFNGTTGMGTPNARVGYGAPFTYRASGEIAAIGTNGTYTNINALPELATFITTTKKPTLASVSAKTITLAPSTPMGVYAHITSPSGTPTLEYFFTRTGSEISPIALGSASPILWNDCALAQGGNAPVNVCNTTRPTDQCVQGVAGSLEKSFSGTIFVPAQPTSINLYSARENASVIFANGNAATSPFKVDGTPDTQLQSVAVSNPNVGRIQYLKDALNLVYGETACASFSGSTFDIIWDVSSPKVVPAALTCAAATATVP